VPREEDSVAENSVNQPRLPCPARSLWQEPPPSLGSGIPARIRSARPITPRSSVTDLLRLHPPSIRLGKGELRQAEWKTPDHAPAGLESPAPAAVGLDTKFPTLVSPIESRLRVPVGAELKSWIAPDHTIPFVGSCTFSSSDQLVFPRTSSRRPVDVQVAPVHTAWRLTSTFFTPSRRIAQPEPAMRPLPAPEYGSRPVAAALVRPTRTAGIIDNEPWKLANIVRPLVPDCLHVVQESEQQLARPRPATSLRPRSVFQDTVPTWRTVPNSYVRRIEIQFRGDAAASVSLSTPLPLAAH
jgi:hypothetical protein